MASKSGGASNGRTRPEPLAGEPREPRERAGRGRVNVRVLVWLAWWAALMALWVMLDDSLRPDELIAGAIAAALGALLAAAATGQAGERFRLRPAWLRHAAELPGQVAGDTITVFAALARTLTTGQPPSGGYVEVPVRYGDDTAYGGTRRVLLTWARSVAPNSFAVGLDPGREVMLVHRLAGPAGSPEAAGYRKEES